MNKLTSLQFFINKSQKNNISSTLEEIDEKSRRKSIEGIG